MMRGRALATAAVVLAACTASAAAQTRLAELDLLQTTWSKINDYQATVVAHEVDGKTQQTRRFHYSFMRPGHAKAEMLDGALRGMIAIWNGGEKVTTYHRGILAGLRLSFGVHDKIVTSLRGNGLENGDLGDVLRCFSSRPEDVRQNEGAPIEGAETIDLVLESKTPLHCPGDSEKDDATITKDVIVVNRATHLPMRRLRYAGEEVVEQWDLLDLRVNTGLSAQDFT